MQVSVETINGLERRMTVEISKERIDQEVQSRLKSLAGQVKLAGFRPGKVPFGVIRKKYGNKVHQEVVGDMVQSSFYEAVTQESIRPAGAPHIEQKDTDGEFGFTAVFEVYPEIEINNIDKIEVEKPILNITDQDIDSTMETIRKQRVEWRAVEREAKQGDRITVDYDGTIDGESFDGDNGKQIPIELGANHMIPGFEDHLLGININEERVLSLKFPAEYHAKDLADKPVSFKVKVIKIEEAKLPELDDDFAATMGVKEGGLAVFREQVKASMQREADQTLKNKTKQLILDGLLNNVQAQTPKTLVDKEVAALMEQQKAQKSPQNLDPDSKNIEEQARRRVALGLILSEIVSQNEIKANPSKVREIVESIAASYKKPEEVMKHYYSDKQRLAEVENFVLEQAVVDWVLTRATVKEKPTSFDSVMNPIHA